MLIWKEKDRHDGLKVRISHKINCVILTIQEFLLNSWVNIVYKLIKNVVLYKVYLLLFCHKI